MSRNCVSILGHRWSKWEAPRTVVAEGKESMAQRRVCERCDAEDYRHVGVRTTYD